MAFTSEAVRSYCLGRRGRYTDRKLSESSDVAGPNPSVKAAI